MKELRQARGITQAGLASSLGVSRQTVNAIEAGKYSPTLEVAMLIARELTHPMEEIFHLGDPS
ncbi:MAG: putative transcriptional regulator [Pontimonas sp.]|jgi:putative transcriptional regulator